MQRILGSLSISLLFAASAAAQCLTAAAGTSVVAGDDVISAAHVPLGLTYPNPIGGALPGGYTHVLVSTNGWAMLTDGVASTGLPGTTSWGSTADTNAGLGGGAGSFPLLAPYWGDGHTYTLGNINVTASTGAGVPAEITWFMVSDYAYSTTQKSFKAKVYDTGIIEYEYSAGFAVEGGAARYVGVSTRNGIATVPPQSPIGNSAPPADSGTSGMCFKTFPTGAVNLADHRITFVQNGSGGWTAINSCGTPITIYPPPSQLSVGTGCYAIPGVAHDSFFEAFTTVADTKAALEGHSMTLTPIVSPAGYVATWNNLGAATYVAPGTAPASTGVVTLPTTDDGTTLVTSPSLTSLSTPFGPFASLTVSHNGFILMGATSGLLGFTPTAATFASQVDGGFFSWIDFYDVPTTSGKIKTEEGTVGADKILYVTWDAVNRYNVAGTNTIQFQLNLTTGQVDILWVALDATNIPLAPGALIGYTAPGASVLPTAIDLDGGGLPYVSFPDVTTVVPMAMSINTLPILDILGNTVPMTWTVTNVPEASHILAGLRACNIVFSIGPAFVGGIDLGLILNAPSSPSGCNGYLFTADAFVDVTTVNGTGICTSAAITFGPPPSLIGAVVTTQAIAIAPPGVYNGNVNNINGGGSNSLWTSNAIQQTYNPL
jgi:hypothetical protein